MKKYFSLLMSAALLAATACDKEDEPKPDPNANDTFQLTATTVGSTPVTVVTGTINRDLTLESDKAYMLSGGVFVDNGATLTIEPGTMVYGDASGQSVAFLSIAQGGMIMANGTMQAPIVMTSSKVISGGTPTRGDWGGIVVNGYADINTGETATGEGGTGLYGGTDDSDNSGSIKYMRVEYAGKQLGPDNELNGFSFNGVGSGTTVEYIQAYMGSDDGIEFFGGTVSVKYAVSTGNSDDSFDWTHGWRGNGQFWVAHQSADAGDRGIEADNNSDNTAATPLSNPTISNLTIVGANHNDGIRLREGTSANIWNAVITGARDGVEIKVAETAVANLKHVRAFGNIFTYDDAGASKTSKNFNGDRATALMQDASLDNKEEAVALTGFVGTTAGGETPAGSFFTNVDFIGAVSPGSDWTKGWVRGLDGTIIQ